MSNDDYDEDPIAQIKAVLEKLSNTEINFDDAIAQLRRKREMLTPNYDRFRYGEYCYQLVSMLMESQKLLNGQFFAPDYIEEKCDILKRIAYAIKDEQDNE